MGKQILTMSFQDSACDIHLSSKPGTTSLVAICNNDEGSGLVSEIELDQFLGNEDGHFSWNGRSFTESARDIQLCREGPSRLPVLHANLLNTSGEYVADETCLAEHIRNIDGQLEDIGTV